MRFWIVLLTWILVKTAIAINIIYFLHLMNMVILIKTTHLHYMFLFVLVEINKFNLSWSMTIFFTFNDVWLLNKLLAWLLLKRYCFFSVRFYVTQIFSLFIGLNHSHDYILITIFQIKKNRLILKYRRINNFYSA